MRFWIIHLSNKPQVKRTVKTNVTVWNCQSMRVKVKEWYWPQLQNKNVHLLIYLTVSLTFAQNSSTSSVNSCNINAKEANLTLPSKCQGQLRSLLKILGQKVFKTVHEIIWISIFLCLTPYKKVKVNPRSLFEQSWSWMGSWTWLGWFLRVFLPTLGISGVPDATYQLSMPSADWFWRRFWKYLTIFRHEGCACHVISTVWTNICSLSPRRLVEIW